MTLGEIPRKSQPVDYLEPKPEDECGVFGLWAPGEDVAKLTYFGLYALQHRGQEAAGIAASDGEKIMVYKDLGLVSQVFDETSLSALRGHIAVGHVRYSTTGSTTWENAQPMLGPVAEHTVALAHNGNLTNTRELMEYVREASGQDISGELGRGSTTDTAVMAALLSLTAKQHPELDLEEVAMLMLPQLKGAFSVTFMTEDTLYAARDPHGVRPLVLGRLERGWVVASETAALDIVGASYVREVEPGEFLTINSDGVATRRFAPATPTGCVFEYVYLARPDTRISGRSIIAARNAMGAALAREHPVEAALVIATPDSGTPAAIGYSQESGIPFAQGIVKTPMWAAPLSNPPKPCANWVLGSSSTRCVRLLKANAWWWLMTRSCVETPSAPWCVCCVRLAPRKSIFVFPPRRLNGLAFMASTLPPALS